MLIACHWLLHMPNVFFKNYLLRTVTLASKYFHFKLISNNNLRHHQQPIWFNLFKLPTPLHSIPLEETLMERLTNYLQIWSYNVLIKYAKYILFITCNKTNAIRLNDQMAWMHAIRLAELASDAAVTGNKNDSATS